MSAEIVTVWPFPGDGFTADFLYSGSNTFCFLLQYLLRHRCRGCAVDASVGLGSPWSVDLCVVPSPGFSSVNRGFFDEVVVTLSCA